MLYNKKSLWVYFVSLLLSAAPVLAQVWFWDTIPRQEVLVVEQTQTTSPSLMAMHSFMLHMQHHDIQDKQSEGLLSLTQEIQWSIVSDIVAVLDQSPNKSEVIQIYLDSTHELLVRAYTELDRAALRINVFRGLMESCLIDKNLADSLFFDAVHNNDDIQAQINLEDSLRASGCATDYRVQLNALQTQYNKLLFYVTILQDKYNYIDTHRINIEQYFFVLKPELLRDLTAIASQLQSFVLVR